MKWINQDYLAGRLRGRAYRGDFFDEGGSEQVSNPEVERLANLGTFKPFALTTSAGRGFGRADGTFGATSSAPFAGLQQSALQGAGALLPQIAGAASQQPQQFNFGMGIQDRAGDIFNQQAALLQPQFAQQNAALQESLFGGGRLGLRLASEGAGAGQGGFVQPDAFGLGRAQQQTLAELGVQSRQQALGEQGQLFGQALQGFGANQGVQNQYLQNLLGASQGLFGIGQGISAQELDLLRAGLTAEQVRGGSFLDAASAVAGGTQMQQNNPGLGFSAVSGLAGGFGSALGRR